MNNDLCNNRIEPMFARLNSSNEATHYNLHNFCDYSNPFEDTCQEYKLLLYNQNEASLLSSFMAIDINNIDFTVSQLNIYPTISYILKKLNDAVYLKGDYLSYGGLIDNSLEIRFKKKRDIKLSLYFASQENRAGEGILEDVYLSYKENGLRNVKTGNLDELLSILIDLLSV